MDTSNTTPIRAIMPERFTRLIAAKSKEILGKSPDTSRISDIVSQEIHTSKYWIAVEAVALETDSKAYKARMKFLTEQAQVAA
jgi:hypothetical protein